jgi:hypothetical protein
MQWGFDRGAMGNFVAHGFSVLAGSLVPVSDAQPEGRASTLKLFSLMTSFTGSLMRWFTRD